jgi:hypothetical protein
MQVQKLTNLQRQLLNLFSVELSEEDLREIRQLLAMHFAQKSSEGMDRLWDQNNWNQETMNTWLSEHFRTK